MDIPTKEQVYEKYIKCLYSKGYFKDVSDEEKIQKEQKAKEYFESKYSKLERFPSIKIPRNESEVTPENKQKAEDHKMKGNDILKSQDYSAALCEYSRAIELNPFNHIYYSNRSLCYYRLNNCELALRDADKCIELCPSFSKGYLRRVDALTALDRFEEANETIDKAIAIEPENVVYLKSKEYILEHLPKESEEMKEMDPKKKKEMEKQRKKEEKEEKKRMEKEEKERKKEEQQNNGGFFGNLLSGLMNNPNIMNMAQSMMNNPQMMSMAQSMMNNPQMMNMAQNMMNNPQMRQMAENMMRGAQGNGQEQQNNQNGEQQ